MTTSQRPPTALQVSSPGVGNGFTQHPVADLHRASVTESDGYSRSVAGIDIEVIRTGAGPEATQIRSARAPHWAGSSLTIGFPVFSRTTIDSDRLGVAVIEHAPPGMRWCGIDLTDGDIIVYSPQANHVATHPVGARFSFAVFGTEDLLASADQLDSTLEWSPGSVYRMRNSEAARLVRSELPKTVRGDEGSSSAFLKHQRLTDLVAVTLAADGRAEHDRSRKLDDRLIVHMCIEYANSVGRIPSIDELCQAAHVSERRLNYAFKATHHVPPRRFFISWALDLARRRLVLADPTYDSAVSRVAIGAGFNHLGRFARYYRNTYNEAPSETLRRVGD